ncbi:MAG: SDR family oxidoreductase [Alphaproteobacteria bacterium]|nr:SDR family oxidoreductase [Alphaproteobacteria bacterium]
MARLAGKVALITGGASGIGQAAAVLFAEEGAQVVVADIDRAGAEETVRRINAAGGQGLFVATDVTEPDSVKAAVERTVAAYGRLNVLYNNAGGSTPQDGPAPEAPLDEFWRCIKLDLFGTFLGCRFGIPAMIKAGGGSVINASSIVAEIGMTGRDCYTAAKGGVAALTRSLAVRYGREGVRVNAVAPAVTLSPRVQKLLSSQADVKTVAGQHLLGLCEPIDIARAALYLASDESRKVTGHILAVDSGVLAA